MKQRISSTERTVIILRNETILNAEKTVTFKTKLGRMFHRGYRFMPCSFSVFMESPFSDTTFFPERQLQTKGCVTLSFNNVAIQRYVTLCPYSQGKPG